jgi:multicomponent Na+:H+ antiporter subunit B
MNSLILRTATRFLLALILLYSVFILLRGHDEPGGGFIGGLIAAGAFTLYGIAYGAEELLSLLRIDPRMLIGVGLGLGVLAGLLSALIAAPFLDAVWVTLPIGADGFKTGTPLIFDLGVYAVVIGFVLTFVLILEET